MINMTTENTTDFPHLQEENQLTVDIMGNFSGNYSSLMISTSESSSIEPDFPQQTHLIHTFVVCANQANFAFSSLQQNSIQVCMIASVVSFLIQLFVYGFVPKLRNLPGKCLMSLSLSLLLSQIFYIISHNSEISRQNLICVVSGIGRHYTVLAAFCWMSVLAIDTHWTFRENRFASWPVGHQQTSTFIKYSIYSWLTPAIIVGVGVIMDFSIKTNNPIKPHYGSTVCGISRYVSLLVLSMIPMGLILVLNIVFFAKTLKRLYHITEETEMANKSTIKERFLWCVKLAIFLGIGWMFHIVSTFMCNIWFQYFANVFLACQGVFILLITTLKRSVYELVKRRINYLRNGGIHHSASVRKSFHASASIRNLQFN